MHALVVALARINLLESVMSKKFGVDSRVQSGKGTLNLEAKKSRLKFILSEKFTESFGQQMWKEYGVGQI